MFLRHLLPWISSVKAGSPVFINADQALRSASVPRRVKTEGNKIATGSPAAHICGRGGIGRLDGFRFRYLSGVRVRVPPPAPKGQDDLQHKSSCPFENRKQQYYNGVYMAKVFFASVLFLADNEKFRIFPVRARKIKPAQYH